MKSIHLAAPVLCLFALALIAAECRAEEVGKMDISKLVSDYRAVLKSKDIKVYSKAALGLRKGMITSDPHRPIYHFTGPESWINDPNGPIYYKGKYHLFYQFAPIVDGNRSPICWGHAVSADLMHWVDWPVVLWPDTKYDRNGVYSGNTIVDDTGILNAFYTGNVRGHEECYGMRAWSKDGGLTWEKKMVMKDRPTPDSPVHWDGQLWKDGPLWYQLIGGTAEGKGAGMLWSSPDLDNWTFIKPIFASGPSSFFELPYLIPLDGRYVLMSGVGGNPYWIGSYDKKLHTFTPDKPEPESFDAGDYYSFNLNMTDNKGSRGFVRRIVHGWVQTSATPTKDVPYWQGAHSIPRVISIKDGRLDIQPIPKIEKLRGAKLSFGEITVKSGAVSPLKDVSGNTVEILAKFSPGKAKRFGINVRASADGSVSLPVWFDSETFEFGVGDKRSKSYVKPGEDVTLRIFVDRSIVEVYVGGRAITKCILYDPAAQLIAPYAEGGEAVLKNIDVWQMQSMWDKT
ncbi:MAG: GH32 C-terminal domain-containing protein [Armatimonadetes bacterium]|nr:GH32 C-terminal domain-containing protein [Armatimonadota bacterium]